MRQSITAALLGIFAGTAIGQEAVDVRTEPVAPGVYVMHGAGGNIGVSIGPDGVFLVDDQYAVMTPKVAEALATDRFADAVREDERRARLLGISGVPFFAIDDRYAVSGAQSAELLLEALAHAWAERAPATR